MSKFFTIIAFIFVLLLIGRNLTFLPKFNLYLDKKTEIIDLKKQVSEIIKKQKGSYSIYYSDLNLNEFFGINENQIHTAASVNKLPIIAAMYYLANKGKLDLDEKIILQKEDIQDYGTGSLRYEKPGGSYSFKTLAKLSLKQSDNTATHIIATKIGIDVIQKITDGWGLNQTNIDNNKSTVYDMFLLFKKIYSGEITNKASTLELLGFAGETESEDRLSAMLNGKAKIYHKTGDAVGSVHDVGIIENNGIKFYLGVMTSDIGDKEEETKKIIGEIAKKIYEYKVNQKN